MERRQLKMALAASLALNLFLVGAGIGAATMGARIFHQTLKAQPGQTLWRAANALPAKDRDAFRTMLELRAVQVRPLMREVRRSRRTAAQLIGAPVYEPAKISALLGDARDLESRARQQIDDGLIAFVGQLPQNERAAVATAVTHGRLGPAARRSRTAIAPGQPGAAP